MKNIAIVTKMHDLKCIQITEELVAWLDTRGITASVEIHMFDNMKNKHLAVGGHGAAVVMGVDLVVVLGGDGTLISATRITGDRAVPILGVNLGSLGFMTEITLDELYTSIERCIAGDFEVTERLMLDVTVRRDGLIIESHRVLNDAVINKGALARIIDMDATVDTRFMTHFKADGLIISTPTGSTGYSLSANGPVIQPELECICITPICPHTLTNRPIVVSGDSCIDISMDSMDDSVFLTLDGQIGVKLVCGDVVSVRKSVHSTRLVKSRSKDYFEVLRTKLKWGER